MNKVRITTSWDDGHVIDLKLAQMLKHYGIKGTFFISPKDEQIPSDLRLTDAQVKLLSEDFEIGAHTMTHRNLTLLSDTQANGEIVDSKVYLEKVLGSKVESFCYPSGHYTTREERMVRDAGFSLARTVQRFKTTVGKNSFLLPTTVHAYRHYSDAWKILRAVGIRKFLSCFLNWDTLAIELFTVAKEHGEVFHLWGHSWEIEKNADWDRLERVLAHIAAHSDEIECVTNAELVAAKKAENKTIVFVTPYFLPHGGGLERYAYEIASRLQKDHGCRVEVITSGERGSEDVTDEYMGIKVHRLGYQFKISNTPFSFRWFGRVRAILKEVNPALVNIHMPVPGIGDVAARVAGAYPVVLTYHAGTMHKGKFIPDCAIWLYEKFILPRTISYVDRIICSSEFVRSSVFGSCAQKAVVVTPGVDMGLFVPDTHIQKKKNELVFVCSFSNMRRLKGFNVLTKALSSLRSSIPDLSLKIIGEKSPATSPNITFVGVKRNVELVKEIQTSEILVLPSLAPAESFGMVLIEAMACKMPVIGSNAGGIPEVISDGVDGLIVEAGDDFALEIAIAKLLRNKDLAKEMGEAGYKKVQERYTWDIKVAQTLAVFNTFFIMLL